MTASARLAGTLDVALPLLDRAGAAVWEAPDAAALYPEYLATLHDLMRETVPELTAARDRAAELAEGGDEVAAGLAVYLDGHIEEERGHDAWALTDLEALGLPADAVLTRVPSPAVAALKGAQRQWIRRGHPVALLGHMAVMEIPPSAPAVEALIERTGHPRSAFGCLLRHAEIDGPHRADLAEALDRLPLEPWHERLVGTSALATVDGLIDIFADIRAAGQSRSAMYA